MFSKPAMINHSNPVARKDLSTIPGNNATPATKLNTRGSSSVINETAIPARLIEKEVIVTPNEPAGAQLSVGPDVKLKGAEILDCDTLVVEGRVEATMDSRVIRIAENGSFSGKVIIDIAVIHGSFDGELTARSQLIIHATGKVSGKIRYGKLVIDEGGELCGDINAISAEKTTQNWVRSESAPTLSAIVA